MTKRFNNRNQRGTRNTVSNVRIVDQLAGEDGARLDRMIDSVQNSHSQTRLICGDYYGLTSSTTGVTARNISFQDIVATDDFQAMAAQFETFRVTAIRFDVYNLNSAAGAFTAFSTYHAVNTGRAPVFTIDQVIDGADSQVVSAGQGKISFTWIAKGSTETQFITVAPAANVMDFGGLRTLLGASSGGGTNYQVIMKAVVDFRGRY